MLVGARRAVLGVRPWWLSAKWMSSAGDKPAAIIDANRDRYALPTLGTTLINPASWQMSVIPTGTATNSPSGTLTIAGDGGSGFGIADYQVATVAGASYCVEYTVATNGCSFSVGTAQSGSDLFPVAGAQSGSYVRIFTATTATSWIRFIRGGAGNSVVTAITAKLISLTTLRPAAFAECLSVSATRSGTASTYVDSDGLMKSLATSDVPRFTWLGGKRRLVVEPAATNLVTYSEDLADASWTKSNGSISSNAVIAPTGAQTGDIFVENSGTSTHSLAKSGFSATSGTSYSLTFFVRAFGRSWVWATLDSGTFGASNMAWFDFGNGVVGTVQGSTTCTITPYGNGVYRCKYTRTATASAGSALYIGLATGDTNASYTGNGTSGAMIWGVQVEATAYPTSYIPTVASTVTRAADSCRFSPIIEAMLRRAEGTAVLRYYQDIAANTAGLARGVLFGGLDTGNSRLNVRKQEAASVWPQGVVGNGTTNSTYQAGAAMGAGTSVGLALAWSASNSRMALNRTILNSDGNAWDAAANAATQFFIGRDGAGSFPTPVPLDAFVLFPTRVSNAALPALAVAA